MLRRLAPVLIAACASRGELPPPAEPPDVAAGERLAGLAGCAACHTAPDGEPLAGGYRLETRFGVFHGSNLTPDPEHGLGSWSRADFHRAMREGIRPDGRPLYPSFPYTSFTWMTDEDVDDLWAWLRSVPPVARPEEPHELKGVYGDRGLLRLWRGTAFREGPWVDDPDHDAAWNRGAYLVWGPGHCGECHTPRGGLGAMKRGRWLAGSDEPPEPAPNITPHADGTAGWSVDDWDSFLAFGMTPEGDFVGGEMMRIVEEGTAKLSAADRAAMAAYLISVPASPSR